MKKLLRSSAMACALMLMTNFAGAQTQQPYTGTPIVLPGTIEAENFDTGGQGVSFYDITVANSGGKYRNESVDIETCSEGGFNVYKTETYEWLEYTVNVPQSGNYKFEFRIASTNATGKIDLSFDGNSLGFVNIPNTGGMQTWRTVKKSFGGLGMTLSTGVHVLRLSLSNSAVHYDMFNLDKVIVSKETQFAFTNLTIPGVVEAEHYDIGGFSAGPEAYYDNTAGNQGGVKRTVGRIQLTENVDIENCSEGGTNIGWIEAGEFLTYTVNVIEEGLYNVDLRVASNTSKGIIQFAVDGFDTTSNRLQVPYTGGWQNWTTISKSAVPIKAGTHKMLVRMIGGSFNLNKLTFTKSSTVPTGCTGTYANDYSYVVSSAISNPSITFNPILSGVGSNVLILYYGNLSGTYSGYYVTPGVPYQINATNGKAIKFYYVYSTASGERNSSSNPHTFTVGSCGSASAKFAATDISLATEASVWYPNPMGESDLLYFTEKGKTVSIKVLDASGSLVLEKKDWNTGSPLDLKSLTQGIFYIVTSNDAETKTFKIIR